MAEAQEPEAATIGASRWVPDGSASLAASPNEVTLPGPVTTRDRRPFGQTTAGVSRGPRRMVRRMRRPRPRGTREWRTDSSADCRPRRGNFAASTVTSSVPARQGASARTVVRPLCALGSNGPTAASAAGAACQVESAVRGGDPSPRSPTLPPARGELHRHRARRQRMRWAHDAAAVVAPLSIFGAEGHYSTHYRSVSMCTSRGAVTAGSAREHSHRAPFTRPGARHGLAACLPCRTPPRRHERGCRQDPSRCRTGDLCALRAS